MAISNIGDLEEINPTSGRLPPLSLYLKAIDSAKMHYANMHVYPHTYLAGYYYRHRCFKQALTRWADAADVISQ